ncbi:MAG: hypothetical protein GX147_06070 [Deltaproteobacteria bacterium]|jgi:hypothetical protein|nr:hypothetical protein [Deltaproteobacteria bacterium]
MAIPDFQSVMLPLLEFCADGQEYTNRQAIDAMSQEFGLTEEEQKQLLPSGQQRIFENRVAWARAHMKMADLVENTKRGVFRITERGKNVLWYLAFCGNMPLKPSWYIMENLSDSKKNDVLPEFQAFLLDKKLAPGKNVFFYALWVSKFLNFANKKTNTARSISGKRSHRIYRNSKVKFQCL